MGGEGRGQSPGTPTLLGGISHGAAPLSRPAILQYAVECSNLYMMPDLTFTINGLPYTLSAQAYTLVVWLQLPRHHCPQFPVAPETKVTQNHSGS